MQEQIVAWSEALEAQLRQWRRDFHTFPETGWTEFRTAALIAQELASLGYEVRLGREVVAAEERMGLPPAEVLERAWQRAREEGAPERYLEPLRGGFTGVVGILKGQSPGPTVAIRCDIDANDLSEADTAEHRPQREGFSSRHAGEAHACGHDGHAAIGLGVAHILQRLRWKLAGEVRLIFQPAEEGVRGAKSMVAAGVLNGCDYFFSGHLGFGNEELGEITCGEEKFLATTKFDVLFTGQTAHAGMAPNQGRNALLAAATAALAIHAIPRHQSGADRVNVGVLQAGSGRNVVPASALLKLETRGETTEINEDVVERVRNCLQGAATMQGVQYEVRTVGSAPTAKSSPELVELVRETAQKVPGFRTFSDKGRYSGSEDVTFMMRAVTDQGGKAAYIIIGTPVGSGHHTRGFDIDEKALLQGVILYSLLANRLLTKTTGIVPTDL